jgi:putative transcriptional regulator
VKPAVVELLPEFVLGTLPEAEAREVEAALAGSPALRQELDRVTEALAGAALALDPVAPPERARQRLMKALDGPERFAPFFAELARLVDLSVEAVKGVLARVDDPGAWLDALPGVRLFDFAAGPALGTVDAGFVRLAPGASFPKHRHLGDEVAMVLEGQMLDGGATYGPGSVVPHAKDSVHDYTAAPDRDLVIMVLHHGIEPV